ncbi:hypothetical protein WJX74_004919 [Apatococcus lobatus]|uniref:ER transporter 6TM N-terminal domain-containing protein n=1 Tax=Apatococcus lobatus TaxID=904363 RepID=A0AAW1Q9I3_9CHLO
MVSAADQPSVYRGSDQQDDVEAQSSKAKSLPLTQETGVRKRSSQKPRPVMGQRPMWQPGVWEKICTYFKSDMFQCAAQSALAMLIVSIFIFVQQLRFNINNLAGIFVVISMILTSLNLSAGGRVLGAALLGVTAWGILLAGAMITVARQTNAYTAWLAVFTVVAFFLLAVIRVMNMIVGFFLGILLAIVLLLGQFEWPAYLLWHSLIWGVIRGIWLSAFITIAVGFLFFARSVREDICNQVADHIEYAGHALSGIAAHLMPPQPAYDPPSMRRTRTNLHAFTDDCHGLSVHQKDLEDHRESRVDPDVDHTLRHTRDPGVKTIAQLRPAVVKTKALLMTAPFEPIWFGTCRIESSSWAPFIYDLEVFSTRIALLESLLEGHEPLLHEAFLTESFGINPLPCFRKLLAVIATSNAAMSKMLRAAARNKQVTPCTVAADSRDVLRHEVREVLQQCYAAWRKHLDKNKQELLVMPVQNRIIMVLRVQSLRLLEACVKLEEGVAKMNTLDTQHPVLSSEHSKAAAGGSFLSGNNSRSQQLPKVLDADAVAGKQQSSQSSGSKPLIAAWKRCKLELEPVIMFCAVFAGKALIDIAKQSWQALPRCFGTRRKALDTLRQNRYFHFGFKFWFHVSWVFVVLIVTAAHYNFVRVNRTFFVGVALITTLQERADAALTRGVLRLTMSLIAATLGFVVMLKPRVADNTYALTTIVCTWAFLIGHFGTGAYKYAAFLATFILNALVFNQWKPSPGSHGTWQYYAARISEYSIGIAIAWIVEFVSPWFLAADVLEQLGRAAKGSADMVADCTEAYIEELQMLGIDGKKRSPEKKEGSAGRSLKAMMSRRFGSKKRATETAKPGRDNTGVDKLNMHNISKKVADPLSAVQLQIAKETVPWKHGPLTMPSAVKSSLQGLQVLLERVVLVYAMAKQEPFVEGKFTCVPYTVLYKPIEAELAKQLTNLRNTGAMLEAVMRGNSVPADFDNLTAAIDQTQKQRAVVEQQVKQAQQQFRRRTSDTEEGQRCSSCSSEDDIFRAYGILLAVSRYTDKLVLFSKTLLRDKFLLKRAPRRMFWRNAAYL